MDDGALVERFRGGDARAFDELVRRHRRIVYRVARQVLGSHEDADEAAQETFVRAWRALPRFRGEASVRTWLVRIALNTSRSLLSRRRVEREREEVREAPAAGESAEDSMRRREVRESVRRAVALLPPRQREVVVLKVLAEMTYRDVAQVMQLSEGAVKAHLHQAVANLRRRMRGPAEMERTG